MRGGACRLVCYCQPPSLLPFLLPSLPNAGVMSPLSSHYFLLIHPFPTAGTSPPPLSALHWQSPAFSIYGLCYGRLMPNTSLNIYTFNALYQLLVHYLCSYVYSSFLFCSPSPVLSPQPCVWEVRSCRCVLLWLSVLICVSPQGVVKEKNTRAVPWLLLLSWQVNVSPLFFWSTGKANHRSVCVFLFGIKGCGRHQGLKLLLQSYRFHMELIRPAFSLFLCPSVLPALLQQNKDVYFP